MCVGDVTMGSVRARTLLSSRFLRCLYQGCGWWISSLFHVFLLIGLMFSSMVLTQANTPDIRIVERTFGQVPPPLLSRRIHPLSMEAPMISMVFVSTEPEVVEACRQAEALGAFRGVDDEVASEEAIADVLLNGTGTVAALGCGGGAGGFYSPDSEASFSQWASHLHSNGQGCLVDPLSGGRSTSSAICSGLAWLAKQQEPEGHWAARRHGAQIGTDTVCTGLALLALLRSGDYNIPCRHSESAFRAQSWLAGQQWSNGMVCAPADTFGMAFSHAIAGQALALGSHHYAWDMNGAAQGAVDYSSNVHQGTDTKYTDLKCGWGRTPRSKPSLQVTAWFVMQLKAAEDANLDLTPECIEGARWYLSQLGETETGAYILRADASSGPDIKVDRRLAAAAAVADYLLEEDVERLNANVARFIRDAGLPIWSEDGKGVDMYYWYFGSMAAGFSSGQHRQEWRSAIRRALVDHQESDGSWRPIGDFSRTWGRVGQTALAVSCLQILK